MGGEKGGLFAPVHIDPQKTLHNPALHLYMRLPAHHQIGGAQNRAKSLPCFLDVWINNGFMMILAINHVTESLWHFHGWPSLRPSSSVFKFAEQTSG